MNSPLPIVTTKVSRIETGADILRRLGFDVREFDEAIQLAQKMIMRRDARYFTYVLTPEGTAQGGNEVVVPPYVIELMASILKEMPRTTFEIHVVGEKRLLMAQHFKGPHCQHWIYTYERAEPSPKKPLSLLEGIWRGIFG